MTTATALIRADIRTNRVQQGLALWYGTFWLLTGIAPLDRRDWLLENFLVVVFTGLLVATYRRFPLSDVSYGLIAAFMTLHSIGAHYSYAQVPFGTWAQTIFHQSRNNYDRLVHFSFGLMLAYPVREIFLRVANAKGFWAYYLPLDCILAFSAMYEIMESWFARIISPDLGDAWLGTQGDIWDAQKDMTSALLGASICMLITWWATRRRRAAATQRTFS
jgi:putative membrane protein